MCSWCYCCGLLLHGIISITPSSGYGIHDPWISWAQLLFKQKMNAACKTARWCIRRCSWLTCTGPGLSLMAESYGFHGWIANGCYRRSTFRPIHWYGYKSWTIRYWCGLLQCTRDYSGIVISPTSIEECASMWNSKAFNLAEMYQCPVILCLIYNKVWIKQSVPSFDLNQKSINRGKMMKEAELPWIGTT